jgi:hypothetical protein
VKKINIKKKLSGKCNNRANLISVVSYIGLTISVLFLFAAVFSADRGISIGLFLTGIFACLLLLGFAEIIELLTQINNKLKIIEEVNPNEMNIYYSPEETFD